MTNAKFNEIETHFYKLAKSDTKVFDCHITLNSTLKNNRFKLIFMWIKTDHISLKQSKMLISEWINIEEL